MNRPVPWPSNRNAVPIEMQSMMTSGEILNVAAWLALRVDARGIRPSDISSEPLDVHDALMLLIEQWHWDLSGSSASPPTKAVVKQSASGGMPDDTSPNERQSSAAAFRKQAAIVTEILATELLVRVYTVLLIANGGISRDARAGQQIDQMTAAMNDMARFARQRFMLTHGDFSWSLKLYRLQKRIDRWSDILLAPTLVRNRLERFWINRANADDWCEHPWNQMADRDAAGLLLRQAIQLAAPDAEVIPAVRARHVERLVLATLMLIPDSDFTGDGVLMSLAQQRRAAVSPNSRLSDFS